jgi:hypothetical protein
MLKLPLAFCVILAATTPSPSDVVAQLHGKPILRSEVPHGSALLGRILSPLLEDFAREQKVRVSSVEAAASIAKSRKRMEEETKGRPARIVALQTEAGGACTTEERRRQIEDEIATLRNLIRYDQEARTRNSNDADAARRAEGEVTTHVLRQYKINQALYKRYGGRVIFQQFGPEPLDAYKAFLLEQQAKGAFTILDKSLESAFWEYLTNEQMHTFFPEENARELMTTAWWMNDTPLDEQSKEPHDSQLRIRIQGATLCAIDGSFVITPLGEGSWGEINQDVPERMRRFFWQPRSGPRGYNLDVTADARSAETLARERVADAIRSAVKDGTSIRNAIVVQSNLPASGSWRYTYTELKKPYPPFYTFGYVTAGAVKAILEGSDSAPKEPAAFREFVAAFRR